MSAVGAFEPPRSGGRMRTDAPFRTFRQPDVEAQLGKKLALGVHQSAGFAVRKNVEIKSVQVFDLDV
jgi:hypothetical protein